jgi:hypothetical protein
VTDVREQEDLTRAGGDMVFLNQSTTRQYEGYFGTERGFSLSATEQQGSRISANDILLAGDHQHHSIVQIRRGAGYAQFGGMPFVLYSQFHIDLDTYNKRRLERWPRPVEGTILPGSGAVPSPGPAVEDANAAPPNEPAVPVQPTGPVQRPQPEGPSAAGAPPQSPAISQPTGGEEATPKPHPLDIAAAELRRQQSSRRRNAPREENTDEDATNAE